MGRLIHVDPLGSKVEYRWMKEFTETVRDARLRDRLEVTLARPSPKMSLTGRTRAQLPSTPRIQVDPAIRR